MKNALRITALVLAAALLLPAMFACTPVNGTEDDLAAITRHEMTPEEAAAAGEWLPAVVESASALGLTLFRATYREAGKGVLVSPLSILTALGMLSLGTIGQAAEELEALLGLPAATFGDAMRVYASALGKELTAANSVWMRNERLHVEESYLQALADRYDAGIFRAPFDEGTVRDVNAWISNKTDGMIPEMIEKLSPNDVMLLINALCFDALWEKAYEETEKVVGGFTNRDGGKEDATFLRSDENVFLSLGDGTTGFLKPYDGGKYAFVGILPPEDTDFDTYVDGFTAEAWNALWASRSYDGVRTAMPAFTGDTDVLMNDMLKAAGIPSVFDPAAAPLRGIGWSDGGELYVGWVLHKTHIEVSAEGTKAAAATVIGIEDECVAVEPMHTVTLDRPFLYAIVDAEYGMPLSFGSVTSPAG